MGRRVALSDDVLKGIAPAVEGAISGGDPPGAVTLLWRDGKVAHVAAIGKRDIERDLPMQRDSLFRIASMTKPITSALILKLTEEGKLRLEDPIVKWAPEFANRRVLRDPSGPIVDMYPAPRDISVEDLLSHRSGIAYAFSATGPIAKAYEMAVGDKRIGNFGPDEFLAALASLPLVDAPGERWRYGYSTTVLGFIAERIEGKPFRDLLLERILLPLGMNDTDFWIPPAKQDRAAKTYVIDPKAGAPSPAAALSPSVVPKFCGGGGGLISSADDYLKFARMLLGMGQVDGMRLLKPETVALMTADRLTPAQRAALVNNEPHWIGEGFGLGVGIDIDAKARARFGPTTNGAYFWPGSFGTWFRVDPAEDLIALYLVQCELPPGLDSIVRIVTGAGTPLQTFLELTYEALGRRASGIR